MDGALSLEGDGPVTVELEFIEPLVAGRQRIGPQQQHRIDEARGSALRRARRATGVRFAICSPHEDQATNDTDQPGLQRNPDDWKTGGSP